MKSSGIGGQAVLEGVMMRNHDKYAVAVRKPDGEISVKNWDTRSIRERNILLRLPIIRGVVAFIESLVLLRLSGGGRGTFPAAGRDAGVRPERGSGECSDRDIVYFAGNRFFYDPAVCRVGAVSWQGAFADNAHSDRGCIEDASVSRVCGCNIISK